MNWFRWRNILTTLFALGLFGSLSHGAIDPDLDCRLQLELPLANPQIQTTDSTYEAIDPENAKFFFHAQLEDGGAFSSRVFTRLLSGERSKHVFAAREFANAINYFGDRITHIVAMWRADEGEFSSDNFLTFQRELERTGSPEAAAASTWGGQQCIKNGFSGIIVQSLDGTPLYSSEAISLHCYHPDSSVYLMFKDAQLTGTGFN